MEIATSYPLIRFTKALVRLLRWMKPEADPDDVYQAIIDHQESVNDPDSLVWPRVREVISRAIAEALTEPRPTEMPEPPMGLADHAPPEGEFLPYAEPDTIQRFVEGWNT
jgi:hypothetical protein